jgi:hypothetical protein
VVSFEPCCDRRRRGQDRWPSSGARCLPRSIPSIQTARASESEPNHRTWIITRSSSPGREEVSSTRLPRSPPHSLGGPWSLASCFAPACVRVTMRPCLRAAAPCGELTSLGAAPRSPAQPACLLLLRGHRLQQAIDGTDCARQASADASQSCSRRRIISAVGTRTTYCDYSKVGLRCLFEFHPCLCHISFLSSSYLAMLQ